MRTPGAAVSISLNVPPWACPGFMSNVSVWLGPPFIHSRMQWRRLSVLAATCSANAGNQPLALQPRALAIVDCARNRRRFIGDIKHLEFSGDRAVRLSGYQVVGLS